MLCPAAILPLTKHSLSWSFMPVWIGSVKRRKVTSLSIFGKHEFKWYSANWSTLKVLRRTYLSYTLYSASRSHFLTSLQTYLQSNISFMDKDPCRWKHMRKTACEKRKYSIKMLNNHNTNGCVIKMVLMAWILMKYIFHSINSIYWLNVAFLLTFYDVL